VTETNTASESAEAPWKPFDTGTIRQALARKDYGTVISEVRAAFAADPMAAIADPVINNWIGIRYRSIFLDEATAHEDVIGKSQLSFPFRLFDPRSLRQRVAQRMIRNFNISELDLEMPEAQPVGFGNTTLLFSPGLITGYLPTLGFQYEFPVLRERFGIRILASDSHPVRGSEANVADLENAIERGIGVDSNVDGDFITADDNPTPPGDIVAIGYSKGSPDFLTLMARRPDLAPRIRGFIGWAGAMGGSYLANDALEQVDEIKSTNRKLKGLIGEAATAMLKLTPLMSMGHLDRRIDEYDVRGAIESLTTGYREKFNRENHQLFQELGVPHFYFSGSTSMMEVAWFNRQGEVELDHYDQLNDMQLTQAQSKSPLPTAPHLAMWHANHWDMSYAPFPWYKTMGSRHLQHNFARESAMASIILMMSELGVIN